MKSSRRKKLFRSITNSISKHGLKSGTYYSIIFLFQSLFYFIFKNTRTKYKIFAIKNSKNFRRLYLYIHFNIANKVYNRQYSESNFPQWDISPTEWSKGNPKLFASQETDGRYEWIERVITREQLDGKLFYLPNEIFQMVSEYYLGEYTYKWGTKNTQDVRRKQKQLDNVLGALFEDITNLYSPDVILSASLADLRWRRAIPTARSKGISWVVTEREGVVVPAVKKHYPPLVRDSFLKEIDLLTTSNETHYNYWNDVGFDTSKLTITGELKSDIWENQQLVNTRSAIHSKLSDEKLLLLYFAFGPNNYLNEELFPEIEKDWSYLSSKHSDILNSIAREFEDEVQIVIKGGHPNDFDDYNIDADNIIFLDGTFSAIQLIINSDIIIGFQTTALIESMFTSKPILYPAWGELHDSVIDQLLPYHSTDAVTHVQSPDEFRNELKQMISSPSDMIVSDEVKKARREFRSDYFYNVGSVGYRTYRALSTVANGRSKD